MKNLKTYFAPFLLACILLAPAHAGVEPESQCSIDWQMRKEMFLIGAFHVKHSDGTPKGTFVINYLPGVSNVLHDASEHWGHAKAAFKPFLEGEQFWRNEIWGSFISGLSFGWDTNMNYGLGKMPQDFYSLWKDMNGVKITEFGGVGRIALDCLGVVASLVCRPIVGAGAMVAGGIRSVLVPSLKLATTACHGLGEAAICGGGVPLLKMVWTGGAWAVTQIYTETPAEQSSMIVTWVPAPNTKHPDNDEL